MKTYTYAGVSKQDGKFKARWANDMMRTKILIKNGHSDIDMVQLKYPMTKAAAIDWLLEIDFDDGNALVREALETAREKRSVRATARKEKVA